MDAEQLSEIRLRQCRSTTSGDLFGYTNGAWIEAYAADVGALLATLDDFQARHDTLMPIIKDKTKRADELAMMNNVLAYQYLAKRVESLIQQNDELKREVEKWKPTKCNPTGIEGHISNGQGGCYCGALKIDGMMVSLNKVVHYAPYGKNACGEFDCGAKDGGYTGDPSSVTCEGCKAKSPGLWPASAEPEDDDDDNEDDVFTETGNPVACSCTTVCLVNHGCQCGAFRSKSAR